MARKLPKFIPPRFYLHYDKKTGEILSVGNEISEVHKNRIEVTLEEHDRFLYGREKFHDWQVGYIRTNDNKTILALTPKTDQGYAFKNNVFEWIEDTPTKSTELTVTWDKPNNQWIFSLSDSAKNRLKDKQSDPLVFFVMLANDFDFLIRTIVINSLDLINFNSITKEFNTGLEQDISKISIASKIYFQSYGLKIND
jgi:hypothetical protein